MWALSPAGVSPFLGALPPKNSQVAKLRVRHTGGPLGLNIAIPRVITISALTGCLMQVLKLFLSLLELIEFLTTPLGLAVWVWLGTYLVLVNTCPINLPLLSLLPMLPALQCYLLLRPLED